MCGALLSSIKCSSTALWPDVTLQPGAVTFLSLCCVDQVGKALSWGQQDLLPARCPSGIGQGLASPRWEPLPFHSEAASSPVSARTLFILTHSHSTLLSLCSLTHGGLLRPVNSMNEVRCSQNPATKGQVSQAGSML